MPVSAESLIVVVTLAACLAVAAVAWKLDAWRRRSELRAAIRMSLAYPLALRLGILAAIAYLVVFFVWGGRGGRIHYFYEEWILTFTALDVVVAVVTAALMGITVALLVQTVKAVGMFKGRESGVGVAGTLLAVAASFCP